MAVFGEGLANFGEGDLGGGGVLAGGEGGRDPGGLSHAHARGLDAESGVCEAVTADAAAGDEEVFAPFRDKSAEGNGGDDSAFEGLGFDSGFGVEVDGVEGVAAGLAFVFAEAGESQEADRFGPTGAVDELAAIDGALGAEADAVDLPAGGGVGDGLGEFVEGDFDPGLSAFFFGEEGVEKLVGVDLVLPVTLGDFPEIGEGALVEFDTFANEFPTDSGDHLFPPSIEESGKGNPAGGHGASELAISFDEHRFGTEASGLDGGDVASRAMTKLYSAMLRTAIVNRKVWGRLGISRRFPSVER